MKIASLVSPGFAAFLVLASAASLTRADDWPQWRGPNRDGISKEAQWQSQWPTNGPRKMWEQKVGAGYSSMAVSQGSVYTMGNAENQDTISCLDAETGAVAWKHQYACAAKDPNGYPGPRCTPTVDSGLVYTLSRHGHLFCLEAKSGKVKWAKNLITDFGGREPMHGGGKNEGWGFSGSPLIEQDILYVEAGGDGASVLGLNKNTGELIWKNGSDWAGYSSLIAFDLQGQRCLAQFAAENLVIRRIKDGSELWRMPWKTSYGVNAATPIIKGDEVFVSSGYGYGCALIKMTATAGKEVWRSKAMRNHVNSCVLVNGFLYGFDDSQLKCLDWSTGAEKWGERSYGKGALMYADGKLILFGQGGKLGVAEATPDGFKQLSSFQATQGKDTWASPVLANGRIYVRNLDTVTAFDVKK